MKPIITLMAVSFALAAVSAAQAQQVTGGHQPTIALSPVQSTIHSPFKMAFDEAREFQGQYLLDNGKTLTVSRKGQRLFADVAGDADGSEVPAGGQRQCVWCAAARKRSVVGPEHDPAICRVASMNFFCYIKSSSLRKFHED